MGIPKYKVLADLVQSNISKGLYGREQPLPSLRQFCQLHEISMTTALATYRYLESLGSIVASEKRGYFVSNSPLKPAQFAQFDAQIKSVEVARRNDQNPQFGFATAQIDLLLMDSENLAASVARVSRKNSAIFSYANVAGSDLLREALCKHFSSQGFHLQPQELVITQGSLDAVMTALQTVCERGDSVAVSSPCYSGLLNVLAVLGLKAFEIPSAQDGLDLAQLEDAMVRKKIQACLLTANHQNPSGHSISANQKSALANMAHQYRVPIIEDDVFRELSHRFHVPAPIKSYDKHGWVMWCSSVSKTLAPGLRLGWCLPGRFHQTFLNLVAARSLGGNTPLQLALADYIERGHYRRHLNKLNPQLALQCLEYISLVNQYFPERVLTHSPTGGLVLWFNIAPLKGEEIKAQLAQQGISIRAGNEFSTTPHYQHYIRINMGLKLQGEVKGKFIDLLEYLKTKLVSNERDTID
ncbi:PLP-dependent aminotransferase family protein [Pseudoalteromonas xiamenensis]|uniref:PLP-dependent aminotransferase family protein n=1 Tax=Pseudoalteromonas xiamenensis TaxID=882626 RepID=A0A975HMR4_9GAMM|nr:PLP-dependent aminotransferase family protein [Pseudoalteromonas xiamenensis]QTH73388.1 PLP-dependent aminotransferase family protein [Pseudoalteromonas xiamenensis]